jgi:isopentenyl-diphosphate delta-isomerase
MKPGLREPELIVLVDETGQPIGSAEKLAAHHSETPLHLAFSCYVFDGHGSFLLTRRALSKKVWPGVWTNSVCGHPAPGETMAAAIRRGLRHELGMTAGDLKVVLPDYRYKAPPFRGIVEHELCPVHVARAESEPRPNPAEVETAKWVSWGDFVSAAEADTTDAYSWWCKDQLRQLKGNSLIAAYAKPV